MKPTKVMTTTQAKAALKKLLKTRGLDACPVCKLNGGIPFVATQIRSRKKGVFKNSDPLTAHVDAHFQGAPDEWLGWWNTAAIEGLTLLPDEWVTNTPADKIAEGRDTKRPWRFVLENHRMISNAGIRCEHRERVYREMGHSRYCVFIDSDFWRLMVDAGKGVKGAREYHALLVGLIQETKRQVDSGAPAEPSTTPPSQEATL